MTEKMIANAKKRLFIRYVAPKISGDMEGVYNAVREPNQIVLINTKRLRRIDAMMLKRMLLKLVRVAEASGRLVFTVEQDFYVTIPRTAKAASMEMSEEERRMLDEFEKIEMEEEMDEEKKKQKSYSKKIGDFIGKKSEREPLDFEIKKRGNRIKEAVLSIKSPFTAEEAGDRMAELIELKNLVSGHVPADVKTKITEQLNVAKHGGKALEERLISKRRKVLRKLEAINDLVESNQISKELFSRIKKHLSEEFSEINDMVVKVGGAGVKISVKKQAPKQKKKAKK